MTVSLPPELERLVNDKVASGLYKTASEVVGEALRLLKERDLERANLGADAQGGVDQLLRDRGVYYAPESKPARADPITAGAKEDRKPSEG